VVEFTPETIPLPVHVYVALGVVEEALRVVVRTVQFKSGPAVAERLGEAMLLVTVATTGAEVQPFV
jgi:hypothetical protein